MLRIHIRPLLPAPIMAFSQVRQTVIGTVQDATSCKNLFCDTLLAACTDPGTTSNVYGSYSMGLPPGGHGLDFRAIGDDPS